MRLCVCCEPFVGDGFTFKGFKDHVLRHACKVSHLVPDAFLFGSFNKVVQVCCHKVDTAIEVCVVCARAYRGRVQVLSVCLWDRGKLRGLCTIVLCGTVRGVCIGLTLPVRVHVLEPAVQVP